jgi:hypothetical protein
MRTSPEIDKDFLNLSLAADLRKAPPEGDLHQPPEARLNAAGHAGDID